MSSSYQYTKILHNKRCSYAPDLPVKPSMDELLSHASTGELILSPKRLTFEPKYTDATSCYFSMSLTKFWCFRVVTPRLSSIFKKTFVVCYLNTKDAITIPFSSKEDANEYLKLLRYLQCEQMVDYKLQTNTTDTNSINSSSSSSTVPPYPEEDLPTYEQSQTEFRNRFD